MAKLLSFSAIATKIRAMQSKLLTENDYRELAALGSVSEAVVFLKKQPAYANLFSAVDETRLHRGQVERILHLSLYTDFNKLYRFSNMEQRKFLNLYFMRYENSILKTCMRSVLNGNKDIPNKDIVKDFFEHYSSIDMDKLFVAHTIEEFVACLKGTNYYKPLSKLLDLSKPTLFDYEMTLDLFYFSNLWNLTKKLLKGDVLHSILACYGSKIDMLNIQWIYRSKKYYSLSPADIYALLIPVSYRLKKQNLMQLVESPSIEEFNIVLSTTYYAKLNAKFFSAEVSSGETLEDLYTKLLDKIYFSSGRKNPYSVACINTYLYRKGHEVERLTTALECIRYGLDTSDTLHYLIK
ncbi:MAG: V-type ATPase subunit [Lachnotalea sp.]